MKPITITEGADLVKQHKITGIKSIKCVNPFGKISTWELDGVALTNGQYVGLDAQGDRIDYWLVEPEDIKE